MQEPVLVLNANFEPINVCSMRRAIGLILTDKAAMVVNGRGYIHTINQLLPRPSVIRLEHMINRPRPRVKLTRRKIFRGENYPCQYCGHRDTHLTIDHIIPKRLGGKHSWSNVVAACPSCNHRKGGRRLNEVQMDLSREPKEPPANAVYLYGRHLSDNGEWEPYITGW